MRILHSAHIVLLCRANIVRTFSNPGTVTNSNMSASATLLTRSHKHLLFLISLATYPF